jgi:pheromone shutdown-related protein TraB
MKWAYRNITLLGTSHIADDSIKEIQSFIKEDMPDIVALELDEGRLNSLLTNPKKPRMLDLIRGLGIGGFLFYAVAESLQNSLGDQVGIKPGSEMKAAYEAALGKASVALIDRDIRITLRRFSRRFRKRELLTMAGDFVRGLFKKNEFEIDISKVPSEGQISFMVDHIRKKYPSIYGVLIAERDRHMAEKLINMAIQHPDKKILAVVGAGHVVGMQKYLKENFI